jgi:hypothetical protein
MHRGSAFGFMRPACREGPISSCHPDGRLSLSMAVSGTATKDATGVPLQRPTQAFGRQSSIGTWRETLKPSFPCILQAGGWRRSGNAGCGRQASTRRWIRWWLGCEQVLVISRAVLSALDWMAGRMLVDRARSRHKTWVSLKRDPGYVATDDATKPGYTPNHTQDMGRQKLSLQHRNFQDKSRKMSRDG